MFFILIFAATLQPLEIAQRNLGSYFIEIVWGEIEDDQLVTYLIDIDPGEYWLVSPQSGEK